jgi:hypothetical protein
MSTPADLCNPLDELPATGPHPGLGDRVDLFGQLVGVWDLDISFHPDDGVWHTPGVWSFGWNLDGRAIQDVLTYAVPGRQDGAAPGVRGIGTTLRHYNPDTDVWRVIYLGALSGVTVILHARPVGGDVHLESEPELDGTLNRWTFTDITDDTFLWSGYESRDRGLTWPLRQRMRATRRRTGT